jgi:hypothetical protein
MADGIVVAHQRWKHVRETNKTPGANEACQDVLIDTATDSVRGICHTI